MSNYYMSAQQRKALNESMNRQIAQSYERLMDLCNERFDENHPDPKLASLNKRLNAAAIEVEDLILSIWDTEEQALAEARQFLSQFTEVNEDDNLSDLQEFFRENRIADFCISFHILPVGDV